MISFLFATGASAGFIGQSWAPAYSTASMASTGALVQPSFSQSWATPAYSTASMASTGALVQPSFSQSWATPAYSTASMASTGALVQPSFQPSISMPYNSMSSMASTGALVQPSFSGPYTAQPLQTSYMGSVAEMGSAGNPFNKLNLGTGKLIGRTAGKNMGARQVSVGEKHVVHNDLKVMENHEADKTIFTKKVIHHSPVLHKTIRTHKIAEDTIHEKLVHHMNTVKDQFKKVPGQNYVGGEQHVDHTEAIASAPMISGKSYAPMASAASTGAYRV